jgi:hypothetical protein
MKPGLAQAAPLCPFSAMLTSSGIVFVWFFSGLGELLSGVDIDFSL